MIDEHTNPWEITNARDIYDNPWISLEEFDVVDPSGKPGLYGVVHFKNLAIGILVLDEENNAYIVGQYRFPLKSYSWEIPMGGGKLDIEPLDSAKRELKEETGIVAKNWKEIIQIHLSNSVTDEYGISYVARDLEFYEACPEDVEDLQVRKLPFEELSKMVLDGEITDSLTVATVLKAKLLMDRGEL